MKVNHGANLYDLSNQYGFSKEDFMDFSSNINPFGSSKLAKDYLVNNIDKVSIYPDPEYLKLKTSISNYCKCSKDNILLGSGATELISSFIETVNPKKSLLLSPYRNPIYFITLFPSVPSGLDIAAIIPLTQACGSSLISSKKK